MDYIKSKRKLWQIISLPIIIMVFVPILFLDIWVEIYHRTCFWLYGLPYINRSTYIKIDRQKLKYLNPLQKIWCMYCWYANWFAAFFVAIAAATEKYRCWIMHASSNDFHQPKHHKDFVAYGDKKAWKEKYD